MRKRRLIQIADPNKYQDLIEAAINNNITIDLYEKYPELHYKTIEDYVHFKCIICGEEVALRWLNIHKRTNKDWICSSCATHRTHRQKQNLPEELWYSGTKDNPYTWEQYIKYHDQFSKGSSDLWMQGTCNVCKNNFILSTSNLLRRRYTSLDEICPNCIDKYKSNLPEILQKNSNAQKIAQNRPEVKEKQRIAQAKAHENDPDLIHKKMSQNNRLRGYFNNIYFASSFELSYLLYNPYAQNCKLQIKYIFNGMEHIYYPDFQYIDNDGKIVIIELKGAYYEPERIKAKEQAINQFIKHNNQIYSKYELLDNHSFSKSNNQSINLVRINTWQKLIAIKKQYITALKIESISNTMLKQSSFTIKQDAIDYINNLK